MAQHTHSCVRLTNIVFYAHHGVLKEEHTIGAKYEVDAELSFDFTDAAQNDEITKTVDYGAVYRKIRDTLTLKKYFLIEAVAYNIAHELLQDFRILDRVSIRVRKRNPPVDGICDYAEADYYVTRA
ncbi:MAG: dihydroneopterin aldolase [Chlorobiaceae bacterium]|nr:dihydroneopterin aldolase [Chlorobiaceae bacterium]